MKRPVSLLAPIALAVALLGARSMTRDQGAEIELVVAATTDVHGWLRGWDYYRDTPDTSRGLARAATIVDSLRATHAGRVVLVDAGDLLQGNPLAYLAATQRTSPHPIIAAMNAMRYDAATIGNHEFNYGLATLDRALADARFPFLAANAYQIDGSRAYPAYTIVERAGVRVAIVGATTPGAMLWDASNLAGRLQIRDIVSAVATGVREARERGRADVVVVVLHSGLAGSTYDTLTTHLPPEDAAVRVAERVPGIDLIVFGHTHREVADTTIGGTMLVPRCSCSRATGRRVSRLRISS
jgi:2',3'-cyclic-nucleotide 2'-phosphodiesterase (5'-nucleotidase family)